MREQQMARTDADEREYVSLAAQREGNGDPNRALAILQYGLLACALIGLVGSLVMLASEK
ncbi:hypothetical protein IVB22_32575 [Bradyrhizobium sp. 190]|uniref:hypothetical protein n=1 Tax=Bradyrhizobium sp. 190 TaxID=2782658 RepID=UPI001FF7D8C4|nr:hypothetical protein [Bradyrhizobium sp. 190]MCK1517158.1 hypothetical protein [Bradyrhizobium sp. 190]